MIMIILCIIGVALISYVIDKTDRDLAAHFNDVESLKKNYTEALARFHENPQSKELKEVSMAAGRRYYSLILADTSVGYLPEFGTFGRVSRESLRQHYLEMDHKYQPSQTAA